MLIKCVKRNSIAMAQGPQNGANEEKCIFIWPTHDLSIFECSAIWKPFDMMQNECHQMSAIVNLAILQYAVIPNPFSLQLERRIFFNK